MPQTLMVFLGDDANSDLFLVGREQRMFAGRQPGSRTLQGIAIKAQYEKLCAAAEHARDRHVHCGKEHGQARTKQNVACIVLVTLASVILTGFAVHPSGFAFAPLKWAGIALAVGAACSTLLKVVRMDPKRETAHFQTAFRYRDLASSCRAAVARYEERVIGDSELQALLDRHISDLNAIEKQAETI